MKTINATNLRKDLYNILDTTIEYDEPISVMTKKGEAVIMSKDEYENIMETLYLTSIPGMKESLLEAEKEPLSEGIEVQEVFGDLSEDV